MKILSKKNHLGCKVLFIWNSIALTGTVKTVGEYSFGIICDSDQYATDRLFIPRSGDEVFVEKGECMKTGEIIPIKIRDAEIFKCEQFPDVKTAYFHLPKYTIYPVEAGIIDERLIEFVPDKHIFQLTNGNVYLYTQVSPGLVTLVDIYNTLESITPMWNFQSSIKCENSSPFGVTENDIVKVYEIPEQFSQYHAKKLYESELVNLIYNRDANKDIPVIHNLRTKPDVGINQLPKEAIFDPNGFKK